MVFFNARETSFNELKRTSSGENRTSSFGAPTILNDPHVRRPHNTTFGRARNVKI